MKIIKKERGEERGGEIKRRDRGRERPERKMQKRKREREESKREKASDRERPRDPTRKLALSTPMAKKEKRQKTFLLVRNPSFLSTDFFFFSCCVTTEKNAGFHGQMQKKPPLKLFFRGSQKFLGGKKRNYDHNIEKSAFLI